MTELRTGDLAREVDGLWEIVGRRGRHAKLFGLRIDLDHLESQVDAEVRCVAVDDTLHAFTERPRTTDRVATALAAATGLPGSAIRVTTLPTLPRTASGKPDLAALTEHARLVGRAGPGTGPVTPELLREEYAVVLGRPDASTIDSFVGLGGDSLSYVELATRLTQRIGDLPADWHTRPIADLAQPRATRTGTRLDTSVVVRASAILLIVGSHANLWTVMGGAHLLLAVAGWNFARFQLSAATRTGRLRHGLTSLAQLVVPTSLWLGLVGILGGYYAPATVGFLNQALGPDHWTRQWQFWFVEALVWTALAVLALLAVPALDRLERRAPYGVAVTMVLVGLAVRFTWVGLETSGDDLALHARGGRVVVPGRLGRGPRRHDAAPLDRGRPHGRGHARVLRRPVARGPDHRRDRAARVRTEPPRAAPARGPGHHAGVGLAVHLPHPLAGLPAVAGQHPGAGHAALAGRRDRLLATDAAAPAPRRPAGPGYLTPPGGSARQGRYAAGRG